jgi:hypothetical protein
MKRVFCLNKQMKIRRGSMLTEGAVFLPVYIIAVVTLIYLVRICWTDVLVFSTVENQVREASVGVNLNMFQETRSALNSAGADGSRLKIYSIPSDVSAKLPVSIRKNIVLENELVYRQWTGMSIDGEAFGYDRMEIDETGNTVYVFPRSGGRYHGRTCRYVNSYDVESVLSQEIKTKYSRCPLCTDGSEHIGNTVYIFQYGRSYHNADCDSVDKYVIEIDKADAVIKGYSECSVCGGR